MHSPPSRSTDATDAARTLPVVFGDRPRPARREGAITIGALIFDRLDQVDCAGPFEVFSRIPSAKVHVVAGSLTPVVDVKELTLTRVLRIAEAPLFDVLHIAGGLG
ncbi:hypothetical protein [Sphingomonas sp. PAMC 26617]|uniref:hypothetical protein n=1 Tax=Sphingomonas sp. PAMC 26617 TaxID=1112216 RepID=UPI000684A392|nr:hypothetical protein [Sphingomonas sp. PAMC 26617]